MESSAPLSLSHLVERLPFGLSEIDQANAAFQRWRKHRAERDRHLVVLWTYCYVRRYFLLKFTRVSDHAASDLDVLVDRTFRKITRHHTTIKQADRYANWVSVVCKHTYLNYLQRRRPYLSIDQEDGPIPTAHPPAEAHDAGLVLEALASAIDRLPPYLRDVARLRFMKEQPYEEIATTLDKSLPTVRSYAHRALTNFRQDPTLRAYWLGGEKAST